MKKLLLIISMLVVLAGKSQTTWNYIPSSCINYDYCVLAEANANMIYYPVYRYADTSLFYIYVDTVRFTRLKHFYNDGTPERLVHTNDSGDFLVSDVTDLQIGYSQITGVPSFLTSETDPNVPGHVKNITGTEKSNWNTSFGWGDHSLAGYVTASSTNTFTNKSGNISQWSNDAGFITASSTNTFTNKSGNISQWSNDAGYLTGVTSGQVTTALGFTPQTQLNGTGFVKVSGTTVNYDNSTYLTAEVDGSTTNEIELPTQTGNSGRFLQTNGSAVSWQTALTSEVDGSTTNEIELPSQTSNSGKFLTTNGTSPSWVTLVISNTAALDFPNTTAGQVSELTISLTGAVVGDAVALGTPPGSVPAGGSYFAYVSATDIVTVRYVNSDLLAARNPASGNFKATIIK